MPTLQVIYSVSSVPLYCFLYSILCLYTVLKSVLSLSYSPSENAAIHQKSLAQILLSLSGIIADIIKQGIKENLFICEYPEEYAEFILSVFSFLLDKGIFSWSDEQIHPKMKALADYIEKGLLTQPGSFSFLYSYTNKRKQQN